MPIPESRNPRLISRLGASRSSCNSKGPPESGSRGIPDSREALPSFSEYLELFHSKAHSLYLWDRETLKYECSVTRTAQTSIAEKALLEPDSNEWLSRLESFSEFAAHLEKGLSSQKRKLYSRYEREYDKFLCKELEKVRAEGRKARADEWDRWSAEWNEVFEGLLEAVESERRYGRERPSAPTPNSCLPQLEVRTMAPSLAHTPDHPSPSSIPIEGTRPQTTFLDNQKVSKPKTPNPPERVHLARSRVSPSSTKPDPHSAPRRLKTSPPSVSCELLPARKRITEGCKPLKSSLETASTDTISRPLPRSRERAKAREQPNKTVLDREPPKGNSLMGAKPSSRVISTPASPVRVNRRAALRPPATTRKEVSMEKRGTSAIKNSPVPRAALTLPKSTPVSYIRALPTTPSSQTTSMREVLKVVSTRRAVSETAHRRKETRPRVSSTSVSPRGPPMSPPKDAASLSSQVIPTRRIPKDIDTRQVVSLNARRGIETRMRVSLKVANPRVGEKRPAEDIECSEEHSKMIMGPAVEQALTLFSTEVGEGRRVTDTVVSIHDEDRDKCSPSSSTTFTLPASTPAAPSVPSTLAVPQLQRSADPIPPFEVISRRRDSKVVNKTSLASVEHSTSPKTTRKWSNPSSAPARVDGGGQLARAAAYIRERTTRRSPAFDEFVCRTPKGPPDRMTESESKRQPTLLAVSKIETSAYLHSPITSAALTPLAPLPAILSQADSFSESSMRLDQLVLKPPDNGGPRWHLYDTVSVSFTPSVTPRSPEFEMGFNPISQPGHVWANPTSRSSSLELVWWERIKPPNKVAY